MGSQFFFRLFGPRFGLKIKEGRGGGRVPPPESTTVIYSTSPKLRAIFHAIEKDKSKPLACTRDMMNNEMKTRIHNNQ